MATCYYPNGNEVSGETVIPCGKGDGVACCPQGWECQNNGLCYLAAEDYYGRYSCTDKSWKSEGCPNICTQDNTAVGNEAILQCSTNNWCCDANRPELSGGTACCKTNSNRFSLDSSKKQKPIGGSSDSNSNSDSSDSSSNSDSATPSSPDPPKRQTDNTAHTSLITSVASSNGNSVSTIVVTSQVTAAASTSSSTPSSSKSIAPIIAPAVIVPLAVLSLAGILALFLLRRRRRHRRNGNSSDGASAGTGALPMYKEEISPMSAYTNQSELEGSSPSLKAAGVQRSPSGNPKYESPRDIRQSTLSHMESVGEDGGGAGGMGADAQVPELPGDTIKRGFTVASRKQELEGKMGLGIQNDVSEQKRLSELERLALDDRARSTIE